MTHIALPARAKLNIELRIVAKAADGFHEIVSTMQAIDLHDTLEVSGEAQQTSLTTSGLEVTAGADNSVLKAHRALQSACGRELPARFHLHKRIPPGSGMGGASSDAAAALRALKALHGLDVDLAPIAQAVGADVPFFLHGGCAKAEGRGERLTTLAVEPAWFALAWPRIELSTAAVYRAWDEVRGDGPNELFRAAAHVDTKVAEFAQRLGEGWRMTGSGSAFFKRCETREQAEAATAAFDCWTAVATAVGPWS